MTWLIVGTLAILFFIWLPTIKRRMLLENAIRFGQEFYGVNVSICTNDNVRRMILFQIKHLKCRTPQEVFFLIAPGILGALDGMKRLELFDGIHQMAISGNVDEYILRNFKSEYYKVSEPDYNFAADALGLTRTA